MGAVSAAGARTLTGRDTLCARALTFMTRKARSAASAAPWTRPEKPASPCGVRLQSPGSHPTGSAGKSRHACHTAASSYGSAKCSSGRGSRCSRAARSFGRRASSVCAQGSRSTSPALCRPGSGKMEVRPRCASCDRGVRFRRRACRRRESAAAALLCAGFALGLPGAVAGAVANDLPVSATRPR